MKKESAAVQAANLWCSSRHAITCGSLATPQCLLIKPVQDPQWPSKQQTYTHLQTDKIIACPCQAAFNNGPTQIFVGQNFLFLHKSTMSVD